MPLISTSSVSSDALAAVSLLWSLFSLLFAAAFSRTVLYNRNSRSECRTALYVTDCVGVCRLTLYVCIHESENIYIVSPTTHTLFLAGGTGCRVGQVPTWVVSWIRCYRWGRGSLSVCLEAGIGERSPWEVN